MAGVCAEMDGFTEFVTRERRALRRAAYSLCGDWHEAEDLVQDTLIGVLHRWSLLECPSLAGGYARRTMYRIYIDSRRHVRWRREALRADVPDRTTADAGADAIADRLMLSAALRQLPPRQRAAVTRRYYQDLDTIQTAEAMECTTATIRSQTARALATMRAVMGPYP